MADNIYAPEQCYSAVVSTRNLIEEKSPIRYPQRCNPIELNTPPRHALELVACIRSKVL